MSSRSRNGNNNTNEQQSQNHDLQKNTILLLLSFVIVGCQVSIVFMLFFVQQFKSNFNAFITSCATNLTSTKRLFYIQSYQLILKVFSILASIIAIGFLIFFIKKVCKADNDNDNQQIQKDLNKNKNNPQRQKSKIKLEEIERGFQGTSGRDQNHNKRTQESLNQNSTLSIKNDFTLINNVKIIYLFLVFVIAVQTTILGKNLFVLINNNSCMNSDGQTYSWKTLILLILASISGLCHLVSLIIYYCINFNQPVRLVFKSHPTEPKQDQKDIQMKKLQYLNSRLINLKIDQSVMTHLSRQQDQILNNHNHQRQRQRQRQRAEGQENLHLKEKKINQRHYEYQQRGSNRSEFHIQNQHNNNTADYLELNNINIIDQKQKQRQTKMRQLKIQNEPNEYEEKSIKNHNSHNNYDEHSRIFLNNQKNQQFITHQKNPINYYKFQDKNKYHTPKNNLNNLSNLNMNSAQRMIQNQSDVKTSLSKRKKIFQNNSSQYSLKSAIKQKNSYL